VAVVLMQDGSLWLIVIKELMRKVKTQW
jgi:hypothetical protein